MLHLATVEPGTLGLLKSLMAELELRSFQLVGGTAMALQVGHRVSIDLDLFGAAGPLDMDMLTTIVNQIGTVETLAASQNIVVFKVNGVKADFVNYRYALLRPIVEAEGVRMVSLADIAPMKLAAIAGRGRKRYFTDLFS